MVKLRSRLANVFLRASVSTCLFYTSGCWSHARRYLADPLKALPKKEHPAAKDTVAYEAIKRIGAIYHLDNQLSDLKPDERRKQRQLNLKHPVEAFFAMSLIHI